MEVSQQTSYKDGPQQTQHEKWMYIEDDDTTCECKEADQTMDRLLECPLLQQTCSLNDLIAYNDTTKDCIKHGIGLM